MKQSGQIALLRFPFTDLIGAKLRPVLLLRQASQRYDDWLVCMVSTQLDQAEPGLDEVILPQHPDFAGSGLKQASVLRLARLAVVEGGVLLGALGSVSSVRLQTCRTRLGLWLAQDASP